MQQLLMLQRRQQKGGRVHRFTFEQAIQSDRCDVLIFGGLLQGLLDILSSHPILTEVGTAVIAVDAQVDLRFGVAADVVGQFEFT